MLVGVLLVVVDGVEDGECVGEGVGVALNVWVGEIVDVDESVCDLE